MKRILITGATGFIGRAAVAEFRSRGYDVLAPNSDELDLLDLSATADFVAGARPTHLAHFAWHSGADLWNSHGNSDWAVASLSLYEAFGAAGGERAFFAGSCAEYSWDRETLVEKFTSLLPGSRYGRAKVQLHEMIRKVRGSREKVVWGRIFFVYGPGEKPTRLAPSILIPLLRNEPAVVRFGGHIRDFLHVADVARAAAHLLDGEFEGAVNIASGEPVTLADFGKTLARVAGRESLLRIEYGEPTPENPLAIRADVEVLRSTGFVPKYSLEAGLRTLLTP
jgi:nucleoside-diphosphate-sugar epimerase